MFQLTRALLIVICLVTIVTETRAAGKGGWSLGVDLGIINSSQTDMNTLIGNANTRESGISVSQLGNAWEGSAYISYRLSGSMVALQFRPSFFYQVEDGSGGGKSFEYSVIGFTAFPIFRFYMLEDKAMAFYSQVGIGFGFVNGEIKEGSNEVKFSGNDLGYLAGLGAEFCFFGGNHCMSVEGNLRILGMERVEADSVSGDFLSGSPSPASLSQATEGKEVELNDSDLGVSMSGIQGLIGYVYYF